MSSAECIIHRMCWLKRKPFLIFMLLLAVFLQGVLPFIHAHTGVSSISGIHTPEAQTNPVSIKNTLTFLKVSKAGEESNVVTVGTARLAENDDLSLGLEDVYQVLDRVIAQPAAKPDLIAFSTACDGLVLSFYSSESYPPPALAPPSHTL